MWFWVVCVEQVSGDDPGDGLGNEDTGVLDVDRALRTSLAAVMAAGCATSSLEDAFDSSGPDRGGP
jgi:hypothetical protein